MKRQIYNYLNTYNIPCCPEGYELLVRVISLSLSNDGCVSIHAHMQQVADDVGITYTQLRSRINYVLHHSDVAEQNRSVNRFIRTATIDLGCQRESVGAP